MTKAIRISIAVLGLLLVVFFILRGMGENAREKASDDVAGKHITDAPAPKKAVSDSAGTAGPVGAPAFVDDDPIGDLRLEGQVVDEDDNPVGGATVTLGSSPSRTATSEDDGTFVFEELVARRYPVYARSSDRVGGPVIVTLGESTAPVIVRLAVGGGLAVEVLDEHSKPISGATVTMPVLESITAQTDSQGIATLRNLPPGQSSVSASAPGYTSATSLVIVPRGADTLGHQRLTLLRGYKVSGVVVDHQDKPVANAKVIARAAGALLQLQDPRKVGVTSDDEGRFELPVVPSGSMRLFAIHDEHAPSTSEPFSVRVSDVGGIKLTMREGASIAGRVTTQAGEPVPWATIRVLSPARQTNFDNGVHRQRIAEEDGSFEIKGLPREDVVVHGASELASSEGLDVDLRARSKTNGLNIVLTIEGTIRGSVVDDDGESVAEVQVQAYPDFWEGADMEKMRVRGPAFATTAGDGSFTLHGLPDGTYRVVASRGVSQGREKGTPAQTGEKNVRVVLASPGKIIGKIELSSGGTPKLATVSVGYNPGVPTTSGRFELINVPPGQHEVAVRGPTFAATFVLVDVKAGETLDMGTVSVEEGRSVQGQVLGRSGQPVPGADVVLTRFLVSDGSTLAPKDLGEDIDRRNGTRRTTTDESGQYMFQGIGKSEWTIASDHVEAGRSLAKQVPAGSQDVTLNLALNQVGSVRGTVRVNGEPGQGLQIMIAPTRGDVQHFVGVSTDERGKFLAERITVGEHKMSAVMMGSGGGGSMASTTFVVESGKEAEALLDIVEGSVALAVTVTGENDTIIDTAQVFLFEGVVDVKTGLELSKVLVGSAVDSKMAWAKGTDPAAFEKVVPGQYSVCITPINGDMNDPVFAERLQRDVNNADVYCKILVVEDQPLKQNYNAVVPPMKPLPED